MPISDEVIELAPVKKTKKTLIIMIAGMAVLLALAVAFLVMYLVKPSVTEDTNHIKDVSVNASALFMADGDDTLYASIGNEYTVSANITVDNNTSTNVKWEWNPELLERKTSDTDDTTSFTFVPRVGQHGKTAKITACSAVNSNEFKVIEFKIVSQGAEDIQIKSWGVTGNMTQVQGDNINKEFSITVPYYTVDRSPNNKDIRINFEQLGAYNTSSQTYAKLTSVDLGNDKKSNDVVVKTKNDGDSEYINIKSVEATGFTFAALKSTNNEYVEIQLQANVNNDGAQTITKTIKVKVESNTTLGYVDSLYVFNKPVVDADFMGRVLTNGNNTLVDATKVRTELNQDKSLKVTSYGDRQMQPLNSSDFELVLPYSNNNSVTYDDIFKHVMINPANAQYSGGALVENWNKDINISSSDNNILQIPTGTSKLYPKNVGKCTLTLKDGKSGSAGAEIKISVRIIAQTTDVKLSVSGNGVTGETDNTKTDIEVNAGVNGKYDVTLTYTFIAPDRAKAETLWEEHCLNNTFTLAFDKAEMDVKLKGDSKAFEPGATNSASYTFTKVSGGTSTTTTYKGTLVLEVTVKKDTTGAAVLTFNKPGSDLFGDDVNSLKSKDKPVELSVSFNITEKATSAKIIEDMDEALKIVTYDGTRAGNFVRKSDTEAYVYVQNQPAGTLLDIVSLPEKLKQFVLPDKTYFSLSNIKPTNKTGLSYNRNENTLSFSGDSAVGSNTNAGTVNFEVLNVSGEKIATLALQIYIIDAVTVIKPTQSKQANYSSTGGSIVLSESDVKANYSFAGDQNFAYSDVDLYFGNNVKFGSSGSNSEKVQNGNVYTFKHNDTVLYEFDTNSRTLTAKTDIYAYSYATGIKFGNVELDFLIKADDEYLGKHTGATFVNPTANRMKLEFIRRADGAALFTDSDYDSHPILADTNNKFTVSVNQDTDAALYASTIIFIDNEPIYIESDTKGHIAPVEKATFTMPPTRFTSVEGEQNQAGRYYNVTYHAPTISESSETITGATVYFNNTFAQLTFVVNNLVRPIKSIGIYNSNQEGASVVTSLLFGGFINEANKYSNTIYVKVVYDTKQPSHTTFESAKLNLPSYLETVDGKTELLPPKEVQEIDEWIFTCEIRLKKNEAITSSKTIGIVGGGKEVRCGVNVDAGLSELIVKNGENTVATITAGNTKSYSWSIELSNDKDIKSLSLAFEYGATNSEGYSLAYDHTGSGLNVTYPASLNGLTLEDSINAAVSNLVLKIDPANVATFRNQKITLIFTDTYNGATENNVFTLVINATVSMDIYALAFADGTDATVTLYDQRSFDVTVKYNDGNTAVQPLDATIKGNKVLDVYTYNDDDDEYVPYTGGITVTQNSDGKTYTVNVANGIDRTQTYYLMLAYDNVTFNASKHVCAITINTLTSHLEFKGDNSIKPAEQQDGTLAAAIVVKSATDEFTLAANVVNDGSGAVETGKTVSYGLYSDIDCTTAMTGMTISNGVIKVTDPSLITGIVYYRALYHESNTGENITLKVAIAYTIAPNAVSISGLDSNMISGDIITLYYGNAGYTQANLSGKILVSTAFANAASIPTSDATITIRLQQTIDSRYLDVNGNALTPKELKTDVPVAIDATYAGETVSHIYHINIKQIAGLSFTPDSGSLNLLNKNDTLTVTPKIATDGGFTHAYTLTAPDGLFTITGGDTKTVGFANNTTAKKGAYKLSATLSYTYGGGANSGIEQVGTFTSKAEFTVNVAGDYEVTFNLTKGGNAIAQYANTEATKAVIDKNGTYGITVTSNDSNLVATTYSAVATQVVSVAAFSGKSATVTLIENTSGAFSITVTATVGSQTYTCTQSYYFVYGDSVSSKLYMSANNGAYAEFNGTTQSIDYTDKPYKFKYEITGLPTEAVVSLVVNGDVTKTALSNGATTGTKYIEITATKPTTLRVGGSVTIGNRTVYLAEKTVELTATAPAFTLSSDKDEILPAGTTTFSIGKAAEFKGAYTVAFTVNSNAYATINATNATSGVLTANANVLADHTVTVTATITISNGAYKGTYTVHKSIVVKGVALPTIEWKDTAKTELSCVDGKDNYNYSSTSYAFDDNNDTYSYTGKVNITVTASSATLEEGTDYTFGADNKLTLLGTDATKVGGSITLTVTAEITVGAHNGEIVSDSLTVRVLPTMNETAGSITIGNAEATYDLNGEKFKSAFAPNGVAVSDYSIIELDVDNGNFSVDGAKLTLNDNISASTTVQVTSKVLITNGTFNGVIVTGTVTIAVVVPSDSLAEEVQWNDSANKYNDLTLNRANVLGGLSVAVSSVTVIVPASVAEYVTVADNGKTKPVVSVHKNYGAYFTEPAPEKKFTLEYIVTDTDGKVYYSTSEYTVVAQKVNVIAKIGDGVVSADGSVIIGSGETSIMQFTTDCGFDVAVASAIIDNVKLKSQCGGNGVQLTVDAISDNQTANVTLNLAVAGMTTTFSFTVNMQAQQQGDQYIANNKENVFKIGANGVVTSTWTRANNNAYKYAEQITVSVSSGNLSTYITSISLERPSGAIYASTQVGNGKNVTLKFANSGRADISKGFNLKITYNTAAVVNRTLIAVSFTIYSSETSGNIFNNRSADVLATYTMQVVNKVQVMLDNNAGGDNVVCDSYSYPTYLEAYNLPVPTRNGYTFEGWRNDDGDIIESTDIVNDHNSHYLYANWKEREYSIEYNDGASTTVRTEKATFGKTFGHLDTPTRTGYDFVCWNDSSDGTGNIITENTLVNPANANIVTKITLYAQWSQKYCTVTLDEHYDGGHVFTFQVPYGQSFIIHDSFRPTREGHRFDGWERSGDVTNVTSNVTLTARWIQVFTVSFDAAAEGEVANPQSVQIANDEVYDLPTITRDGYEFGGWYNGEVPVENGTTAELTGDIELTAHWNRNVFTVTLNAGYGKVIGDNSTYTTTVGKGQSYDLHLMIVPTRDGYTFDGWWIDGEDNEADEEQDSAITVTEDITLTAHWTANIYTVTFDANGGTLAEGEDTKTVTYDGTYGELPTLEDYTDGETSYTFAGWYISAEDDADEVTSETTVDTDGNHTLYAHWTEVTEEITGE